VIGQTRLQNNIEPVKPIISKRKPLRYKENDYSLEGSYFVTICTKEHQMLFGGIVNGEMNCNRTGKIAEQCWNDLPKHFSNIILDEFVVMPNHVHEIIVLVEKPCRDVQLNIPTEEYFSKISPKSHSLSVIVRTYKAAVTTICRQKGYNYFQWQKGYYDHIIRNKKGLQNIQQYIYDNPIRWNVDKENSDRIGEDEFEKWLKKEGNQKITTREIL